MGQYLHLYETEAQFNADYNGEKYNEPWVSYTTDIERIDYNKYDPSNGHPYVDLGLSSGTLWATCNLGASSPEQYGDYYAWGEIEPNKASTYTWDNYRFGSGSPFTKYDTDNKLVLDLEDDAANVVMGGEWHMPTRAQLNELTANTTSSWTTDYNGTGVAGAIFTSNSNGNSIFFPAAGRIWAGGPGGQSEWFYVWSSSRNSNNPDLAWFLLGDSGSMQVLGNFYRYVGLSVRGVLGELSD